MSSTTDHAALVTDVLHSQVTIINNNMWVNNFGHQ